MLHESEYQPKGDDIPTDIKTVDYAKLSCILWTVCKEQQQQIESLNNRLNTIEKLFSNHI